MKIRIITRNCEISDVVKALILHYNLFMMLLGKICPLWKVINYFLCVYL